MMRAVFPSTANFVIGAALILFLGAGAYAEEFPAAKPKRTELEILLQQFKYDRSLLPDLEKKIAETQSKLYQEAPEDIDKQLDYLYSLKRSLNDFKEQYPIYEEANKTLEDMLKKLGEGEKIGGLYTRLYAIRKNKLSKITSPFLLVQKRELNELIEEITDIYKKGETSQRLERMNAARRKIEERKREKKIRKGRQRAAERARIPKHLFASEFDKNIDGWINERAGNLRHSISAPDTQEKGFLKWTRELEPQKDRLTIWHTLENVNFSEGMTIEVRIYREKACWMSFQMYAADYVETIERFMIPPNKWITVSKKVSGICALPVIETRKKLALGTPYSRLRIIDWGHEEPPRKEAVYMDYIRILPPPQTPEPEEQKPEEQKQGF